MGTTRLANADVRAEMKKAGVPLWQIADALRVCELTVTRKLRRELDSAGKIEILALIAQIAKQRNRGHTNDADSGTDATAGA
jgi:IS30 family transposase